MKVCPALKGASVIQNSHGAQDIITISNIRQTEVIK